MSKTRLLNINGNTSLHQLMITCTSYEDFVNKSDLYSVEKFIELSLTLNDNKKLPFDIICERNLPDADKNAICDTLIKYMLQQNVKSLHQELDFQHFINAYHLKDGTDAYHVFKHACDYINEVRRLTTISFTHPSLNKLNNDQISQHRCSLDQTRTRAKQTLNQTLYEKGIFSKRITTHQPNSYRIKLGITSETENILQKHINHSIATKSEKNCGENATFIKNKSQVDGFDFQIYRYKKKCGDHSWNIHKVADIDDENDIFIDGWRGDIYLRKECDTKLGDYRKINYRGKNYNFIIKYNANFHKIEKNITYKCGPYTQTFTYKESSKEINQFVNQLIFPIIKQESQQGNAKQIFLFGAIIKPNLKRVLKAKFINQQEIKSWGMETKSKLEKYFSYHCVYNSAFFISKKNLFQKDVKEAIESDMNPDQTDHLNQTLLHFAACFGYNETVKYLLSKNANPNITTSITNETPLFFAIKNGHLETVKILLSHCQLAFTPAQFKIEILQQWMATLPDDAQMRMQDFIQEQRQDDPNQTIFIHPIDIAAILGNRDMILTLKQYEESPFLTHRKGTRNPPFAI